MGVVGVGVGLAPVLEREVVEEAPQSGQVLVVEVRAQTLATCAL